MMRPALMCLLVLSLLAAPAAAATSATRTSAFAERSASMRAVVSPGDHPWSQPASCTRAATCPSTRACPCPAPTTQIVVVNVNAPVIGDVVVINSPLATRRPALVGSVQTIAGRATVQPTLNAMDRVVVRRW